jgi:hypothetical protein
LPAVIEIGYPRNDDFFGTRTSLDEEIAISGTGNTEKTVCIAETGHRRVRHPVRKKSEPLDETEHNGFRIDNSFLNQYDPAVTNVLLDVNVRAGNHQIVGPLPALVVDAEAMILQKRPTAFHHPVACYREFDQPEPSKNLVKAVAIVGREGMLVIGKVPGNLDHLGCLIHRTTDEEDPFSHWRLRHFPFGFKPINKSIAILQAAMFVKFLCLAHYFPIFFIQRFM